MKSILRLFTITSFMLCSILGFSQTANVQIIHNSPDALAAEVDIYLDGVIALQDVAFRTATAFIPLPAGVDIEIGIAPGTSVDQNDIIATFPVNLVADENYVVMATGLLDNINYTPFQPFTLNIFAPGQQSAMPGMTDLLVYHGSTDAPAVDVNEIGVGAGTLIDGFTYGSWGNDAYASLPTADYILDVTLDDGTIVGLQYEAPLSTLGLDGAAAVVYASGFLDPSMNNDGPAFGLWATLPDGTTLPLPEWNPTANVQIIHNSADALAETVDIYLDGELAVPDLAFRTATEYLALPAYNEIAVGIAPGNSVDADDIIATFNYNLDPDETYNIIATGLLDNVNYMPFQAFDLAVFAPAQIAAMMGTNTDVLVYHGSTDAPTVDVNEVGVGAGTIVDGISYGEFNMMGYLELPTADYILDVTLDDGTIVGLQYEAPLSTLGLDGAAAVVYASGFLDPSMNNDGPAFGLWATLPDGTTLPLPEWNPTANVQIIHNSADALAETVDIYLNGELAVPDLAFRTATEYLSIPAYNEIAVGIAPGNSVDADDIIATFNYNLDPDETYNVIATGLLDNVNYMPFQAFDLAVFAPAQVAAMMGTNTDVLVYHGSTDAPTVDVNEVGVGAGTIVDGISYGEFNMMGYLELPTADYILDVTLDDGTIVGLQYEAPLSTLGLDGAAAVVYASGFLDPSMNNDGPAFGLWATLPDGTTLPLPVWEPTARVQILHNSADALAETVDIYLNGELAVPDLAFRNATPYIDLPAYNEISVGIAPGNSVDENDIIASFPFTLAEDETYLVIANGLLDMVNYDPFQPFNLEVFAPAREAAGTAGNTDLLVFHGATDAPTVDVYEVGLAAGELLDDVAYSTFGGGAYLELGNDDYYVQVRLDDGVTPVATYEAPLETLALADGAGVVFATGFLDPAANNDGPAFGLWVALPDGTTLPLPALGTAPVNNQCVSAEAVDVVSPDECGTMDVMGTLSDAWNDYGTPDCELAGILPDVYYTFNSGNFNQISVDITALGDAGPEIGFHILSDCGEPATEVGLAGSPGTGVCIFNASLQGQIDMEGFDANTDYTLAIFSNLDFGNATGDFSFCLSGDIVDNVNELADAGANLSLYPNPNNGVFNLNFDAEGQVNITITDITGKLVQTETVTAYGNTFVEINSDLSDGMYILTLNQENNLQESLRFTVK